MRQVLLITAGVVLAVSLIVGLFALNQVNQEQLELTSRMQSRSQVLAESLSESIEPSYNARATNTVQRIIDRFVSSERLAGLAVFDNAGNAFAISKDLPLPENGILVSTVMDSDEAHGEFVRQDGETYYVHVTPLHKEQRVIGALAVAQNATYIDESIADIWRDNLVRLLFQVIIFAGAIFILVRWVFHRSISKMVESLQSVRKGEAKVDAVPNSSFFKPLAGELSKVTSSLHQARRAASEEARMRLEKIDSPWTAERLKEFIKAYLKDRPIFVLSHGEPYVATKVKNEIEWRVPAGGVITAIEPVMEACGGTWIAYGGGNADKETADAQGKLKVPPDEPRYTLKRVWLTPKEFNGYYNGFSNDALWPLCHMAHVRPQFRKENWGEYRKVNGLFAKTLLEEIRNIERPIVLVQDYHLALVPALIKKSRPDAQVALFWHIPWPSAAQFNICPWRKEILEGMLGADLIGFQTQQYCNNFIDTVANEIESRIDLEQFAVFHEDHRTFVKPFPVSIAYPGSAEANEEPNRTVLEALGIQSKHVLLGVDRLDYIKGIPERFKGLEFLLEAHPEYRGNITFLQIASPTRESVEKYREYAEHVVSEAERINEKFGTREWKPIVLERRSYSHAELRQLYQLADVCLVTSLHDGMNLVAKEFAAARSDESGVLVLSHFTGASRDLKGALLINPYSAEETSAALHTALTMPKTEQHKRMKMMRMSVRDYNIYRWSAELIKTLSQLG
ncbi:trehalose-6-phosphate synthase [Candidatus Kaiserbacteria bacterium CG10_big_fil_rev_8_21_14_0_10_51_14]|uniref:Trehalose-6-phosphate synthase n=1 Tax=Candidatus Kaiserbacteria bacterium CG10_big_fil_rev_8_21_14_0_10_51_14 TaxID=1974610 RepID=A0A2H0UCG5_9BACT|nr:MAG: trehalose-6-phosphate synthase [Candidatus Kaiserbacteria bacterium CG10_big_fil_rev_8_21_14_0_10_51_14]